VNFDGSNLQQVTQGALDLSVDAEADHNAGLTINTDGTKIAFSTFTKNTVPSGPNCPFEVCLFNYIFLVDTTSGIPVVPVELTPGFRPSISGDGSKIVFQEEGSLLTGEAVVYLFDVSENITRRLSPIAADCPANTPCQGSFEPKISADGTTVVFYSREHASEQSEIFVINSDGSDLRQFTFDEIGNKATISADGSRIAWPINRTADHSLMSPHRVGSPGDLGDTRSYYRQLKDKSQEFVDKLVGLSISDLTKSPKHIIVTWHAQPPKEDINPTKASADQVGKGIEYEGKVLPMIEGSYRRKLAADFSCQIYAEVLPARRVMDKTTNKMVDGSAEYVVQVQADANRFPKVADAPPMTQKYLPNDFKVLYDLIVGKESS